MNPARELDDPLDDLIGAPLAPTQKQPPASYNGGVPEGKAFKKPEPKVFEEKCGKCRGTGSFFGRSGLRMGQCFACKGTGKNTFKTSPEKRASNRLSATNTKAKMIEAFKAEHTDIWAWMDGSTFPPAVDMRNKLEKYGSLFDSSIDAARRMIAKRDEAKAASMADKAAREASAQEVNTTALETAFAKAAETNKRIALWIGTVRIKPAKNKPGVLYVVDKNDDLYLGKVAGGKFTASREGRDRETEMLKILQDPKAAAIEHGKLTGACAVCSRELTDANSIAAGIGPVCSAKMGW